MYIYICYVGLYICSYKNHDIAIAMSSPHADPVLGLNILQGWD